MKIYQVVLVNKQENKIYHVGHFKLHAHATACMKEIHAVHSNCLAQIWENVLYEAQWDGAMNYREELTYGLR